MIRFCVFWIVLIVLISSCATQSTFYKKKTGISTSTTNADQRIFFLGGKISAKESEIITNHISKSAQSERVSLILTGNITSRGLPDSIDRRRRRAIESIDQYSKLAEVVSDKVIISHGFRDWGKGSIDGFPLVENLNEYLSQSLNKKQYHTTSNGCPGPEEIRLSDDIMILLIDTQWILHGWNKPLREGGCDVRDERDFYLNLQDAIKRNEGKRIIIVGSHPIYNDGKFGGNYRALTHLTPPILGSLYVLNRKVLGAKPDLANPDYRRFRKSMITIMKEYTDIIYLAGHDPSLQYHHSKGNHFVVSGSVGQSKATSQGKYTEFSSSKKGFGELRIFNQGKRIELVFWDMEKDPVQPLYRRVIIEDDFNDLAKSDAQDIETDFKDQYANAIANSNLRRKASNPLLLGSNYRQEWTTEINNVEVFDIGSEKGGLRVIKKGGGAQTNSLRLEDSLSRQWVLRSIRKFPEKSLEVDLHDTYYSDILKDQVSASHPFGAFAIPKMADAIDLYHTNPRLVYLPDDARLGIYQYLGNELYLFEERPDEDREDVQSFGRSKNIIGTPRLLEKISDGDEVYVDQFMVVKSRLFDLLLGDWDRHEDQWRWSEFPAGKNGELFKPIPRDRDQVFYNNDGLIVKLGSRKWISAQIRGFHHTIKLPEYLAGNGIHFDRTFLNQLSRNDWLKASSEIRKNLTDESIEAGIADLPADIRDFHATEIISKLKQRRNDLDLYANRYYSFLSKEVDVVGTKKQDQFEIHYTDTSTMHVKSYRLSKKGNLKFTSFERTFYARETSEVRIYGLDQSDIFKITGKPNRTPTLRIIGGLGNDVLIDSTETGMKSRIFVYDDLSGMDVKNSRIRDRRSNFPGIHRFNRRSFKYDQLYPLVFIQSNPDDGIFIGGGFGYNKYGFRKNPAQSHFLRADLAPRSRSFNAAYSLKISQVLRHIDFRLGLSASEPAFADFFYGFGNKTTIDNEQRQADGLFYRVRYSNWKVSPGLSRDFGANNQHRLSFSVPYQSYKIRTTDNDDNPERFILNYDPVVLENSSLVDVRRNYLATTFEYSFDTRNNKQRPSRGVRWVANSTFNWQLGNERLNFQQLNSEFSFFIGTGGPFNPVLATRIGATTTFGDFLFYHAARIGGTNNLRGYRKFRFAGDESVYQNTELRFKLFKLKTRLLPIDYGLSAFHDIGRVWADNTDEDLQDDTLSKWHRGYGGALWIALMNYTTISFEFAGSVDNKGMLNYIRFGFMF